MALNQSKPKRLYARRMREADPVKSNRVPAQDTSCSTQNNHREVNMTESVSPNYREKIHKDAVIFRHFPRFDILTEAMETFHLVGGVLMDISGKHLCYILKKRS